MHAKPLKPYNISLAGSPDGKSADRKSVTSVAHMAATQTFAWGPALTNAMGCRGYRERHVFRVASCPGFHFMRSLQWRPSPIRLQAISEELQQSLAADEFVFSGPCVDCLQNESDNPVRPTPETLSVHAGEREGRPRVADSLTTPIVQTATYTFRYWLVVALLGDMPISQKDMQSVRKESLLDIGFEDALRLLPFFAKLQPQIPLAVMP